ncbi:uncharacterized protein [Aristolochia californica]|uniref:uncharacterized protein n=1 Tax=Aristolochia californica TaxID=171875 RepID=UPI0035E00D00
MFEFFSDVSTEMCAAEDVFLHGTILPNSYRAPSKEEKKKKNHAPLGGSFTHQRSYSLDTLLFQEPRNGPRGGHRKLQRGSSAESPKVRSGKYLRVSSIRRHKWHLLTFGLIRPPAEMEMEEIRNRQRRLSPSPWLPSGFPASVAGCRDEVNKNSWRFLRALSCRGHEAIAVA